MVIANRANTYDCNEDVDGPSNIYCVPGLVKYRIYDEPDENGYPDNAHLANLFEWQQNGVCGATSNAHLNRTSGQNLYIKDIDDNIVTSIQYHPDGSNGMPSADTLLETNSSLELISVDGDQTDPTNWQASYLPLGTPGLQNTEEPYPGCTDPSSCTYNSEANEDDGSCLYEDCAGECGGSAEPGVCGCDDNDSCLGCIDPIALNYDETAIIDDGSCEYFDYINKIVINEIHYNPDFDLG